MLIASNGRACLADFGLVTRIDSQDLDGQDFVGTPYWRKSSIASFTLIYFSNIFSRSRRFE